MRPVMILRPEPGNTKSCAAAHSVGLVSLSSPLFSITPLPWTAPPLQPDAILITSANAIRHGGPQLSVLRHIPVWAVGEISAQAARDAGFTISRVGQAGMAELLTGQPPARLLHLCGEQRSESPHVHQIVAVTVYTSQPAPPPPDFSRWIGERPVVLLHSPRAAQRFTTLVDAQGQSRATISLVAISAAAACAAGPGWEMVAIAPQTSDEAMLELAWRCAADTIRVET